MKHILFIVIISIASILFQNNTSIKVDKNGFVTFTDENLLNLLKMDKDQWESKVKSLGYEYWADEDGILMYMKGKFTESWHTVIYDNKLGMVGILWWDLKNKEKLMEKFRASMPNKYLSKNENVTTYLKEINGKQYTIIISNPNDVISEEVRIGYRK